MYGRLVNARSPYWLCTAACQPQNCPLGVPKPSGCVPEGDTITYCAFRLAAGVVAPKCAAALTATDAIWTSVACDGAAAAVFAHTPASASPLGTPTCGADAGHDVEPAGTPSQYWDSTPF